MYGSGGEGFLMEIGFEMIHFLKSKYLLEEEMGK